MKQLIAKNSLRLFLAVFFVSFSVKAQLQITTNLDGLNYDQCLNRSRNLLVSVKQGTCLPFNGNLEAAVFTWQIESSPGVWTEVSSFPIAGVSYSTNKFFNAAQTQITSRLIVTTGWDAPETLLRYRVLIQGLGGCPVATSTSSSITTVPNRWLGDVSTDWDNPSNWSCSREPGSNERAVVQGPNSSVMSLNNTVKGIEVQNGGLLTIASGVNLTLTGPVSVFGTGNFLLLNNANLIQNTYTGANTGQIHVFRNSSALMRQDYTLWSSPVNGQNLQSFSPQTLSSRFYEYNTNTNVYSAISSSSNFQIGKGYLIRMPNNHPDTPTVWNGEFTGVPNNGTINIATVNSGVGQRFNAIGNPYPSPVRMNDFVSGNSSRITGTLYFWRKTNNAATDPGYCTWTLAGFVSNGEAQVENPNGILRTAQGFLVEMINTQNTVTFNNSMRVANIEDQFFKSASTTNGELDGDKFYLNIQSDSGAKNQMLLGYFDSATLGVDYAIDGKQLVDSGMSLTTVIDGNQYLIEGRATFENSDIVPLTFETENSGQYTISLSNLQGVFAGQQAIYLKDKLIGISHNLKQGSYTFVSEAGDFSDRFEIVYSEANLSNSEVVLNPNSVVAYSDGQSIVVKSSEEFQNITIYDLQGRLLTIKKDRYSNFESLSLVSNKSVLLIEIEYPNGSKVHKKVVH